MWRVSFSLALLTLLPAVLAAADDPKAELANKATGILKAHCYRCHGEAGAVEGGFNYVADLDRLVNRKKILPGKADESPLYKRIANGSMPPADVKARLSDADKATLKQWIDGGAHTPAAGSVRPFVSQNDIEEAILADLEKLDRRSRRFVRYLTLTNLSNAGASDDEVITYRNALNKLINSLSWHPKIRNPEPINAAGTLLRIDLRWYMWDSATWNRLLNDYPYGILDDTTAARAIMVSTATKLPLLRADWFVATASRPLLYQDILQLPANLAELERQLRVDAGLNITQERVMRVAFNGSGISKNNRILERHDAVHGYYWRTYDFEDVPQNLIERGQLLPDRRNVFAYPLGPGNLENTFQHAGGEAIFSLPNGLQGYYIMNSVNNRLDKAPNAIVSDPKRPDRAVEMGVSCMGCHIPGILTKADQMHDFLEKNPKAIARLDADIARVLYPAKEVTQKAMEEDSKRFTTALALTGVKVAKAEPIITMTLRYEGDIDAQSAAAEVGLPFDEFQRKVGESSLLARNLGALRVPGGTVARQIWVQAFGDVVREMKLGVLFQANQVGAALADNTGELDPLEVAIGQSNHMSFSGDGRLAIIASADRSVQSYEVEGKRVLKRFVGHTASVWSSALSKDGKYALSGSMDGSVRLWRVEDAQQLSKLDGHTSLVTAVAFTPNGKWAVSGGFDGTVIYWNLVTGKEVKRYEGPMKYINALAVSPDGKTVLIAADKLVRIWDIASGAEVGKLEGHTAPVTAVAFSVDGKKALTGSDDRSMRLWDIEKLKQEQIFSGHDSAVRAVAFNDKGNWALSGGNDATVRLWQTSTGKELGKFAKHTEPVMQVAFLDNGKQTLSGSRDNAMLLWGIDKFYPAPKAELKTVDANQPIDLKPAFKLEVGGTVGRLFQSRDGESLYAIDRSNGRLLRIDAKTGKIVVEIDMPHIEDASFTVDDKNLVVLESEGLTGKVNVADPATLKAWLSLHSGFAPRGFGLSDGQKLQIVGEGAKASRVRAWFKLSDTEVPLQIERVTQEEDEFVKKSALKPNVLAEAHDRATGTIYRVTDTNWLEQVNPKDGKTAIRYKLPVTAYQIAYDSNANRLFLAVIDPQAIKRQPRAKGFGDIWAIDVKDLPK